MNWLDTHKDAKEIKQLKNLKNIKVKKSIIKKMINLV